MQRTGSAEANCSNSKKLSLNPPPIMQVSYVDHVLSMFTLAWTNNIPSLQMVFVWLFLAKETQCKLFLQSYLTA